MKAISINLIFLTLISSATHAEVISDGSVGSGALDVSPVDGNYAITADMGIQSGATLFHSFETFNIESAHTATFSGSNSVNNIITRVTGDSASTINGTIASTIPGADLWMINPKGFVFGEGAALDIKGSFHAGTADYIQLRDGIEYSADLNLTTLVTSSEPQAFGFINDNTISNTPLTINRARLSVPEGETISLVGSNIQLNASVLSAPGGLVSVVSISEAGEVYYSDQGYEAFSIDAEHEIVNPINFTGELTLSNTALKVDGDVEGNIQIQGGDVEINTNTTDVIPSVSNLKASFYEEESLLENSCELADFYGKGSFTFTVNAEDEEGRFGVELKKSRGGGGALGFIEEQECL